MNIALLLKDDQRMFHLVSIQERKSLHLEHLFQENSQAQLQLFVDCQTRKYKQSKRIPIPYSPRTQTVNSSVSNRSMICLLLTSDRSEKSKFRTKSSSDIDEADDPSIDSSDNEQQEEGV